MRFPAWASGRLDDGDARRDDGKRRNAQGHDSHLRAVSPDVRPGRAPRHKGGSAVRLRASGSDLRESAGSADSQPASRSRPAVRAVRVLTWIVNFRSGSAVSKAAGGFGPGVRDLRDPSTCARGRGVHRARSFGVWLNSRALRSGRRGCRCESCHPDFVSCPR